MTKFEHAQELDVAIKIALEHIDSILATQEIATIEAYGRILAQEIVCPVDLPAFARSAMDGYAVRATDTQGADRMHPVELYVIGSVQVGQDPKTLRVVESGETLEITTGGPMPSGADAVAMVEDTERLSTERVKMLCAVDRNTHVLAPGSNFTRGEKVFGIGHGLRPVDIGALLAMGILSLNVYRRIRVGLISTGDELVEAVQQPRRGQIREINSSILRGLIESQGAQAQHYAIVPDDRERLGATVGRAVRHNDLVLMSGGSSVGPRDWTLETLEELGNVFVHGLQIKPGRPTIFGVIEQTPVVGLPGNPVSCAIVFERFVRPLIAKRSGLKIMLPSHRLASARLLEAIHSVLGREDFIPVRLRVDRGAIYAEPIRGHSNNISTLARAEGVLSVPAQTEEITAGTQVWVELL